jgi:hypothetical protein
MACYFVLVSKLVYHSKGRTQEKYLRTDVKIWNKTERKSQEDIGNCIKRELQSFSNWYIFQH